MQVIIADNTHEIVMEKLEQYKAELAVMDRKKLKEADKEGKEDDEDDGEKKKKAPPKLILCTT